MNPIRLFALQSARVPPNDMQPGATGSPEIDAAMAAAICSGMPERWYRAAMYKWGLDDAHAHWLLIELWMATIERSREEKWKTSGKPVARCGNRLSVEVSDDMDPPELADYEEMLLGTDGTKEAYIVSCIALREVGVTRFWGEPKHWKKKAVSLGVGKSAWFDTWDSRVVAARQTIDDWAGRGYSYASRRQRVRAVGAV